MPVTETLFYYTEDDFKIPSIDERKMLVFMRSCDVHRQCLFKKWKRARFLL